MVILHSFEELHRIQQHMVLALGTFDGLHKGHRAIIERGKEMCKNSDAALVIVTFDRHPFTVLRPTKVPPQLYQIEKKYELLASLGVEYILELPMNQTLLSMKAEEFMHQIIEENEVVGIVIGSNFSFGKDGTGDPNLIRSLYPTIDVVRMPLIRYPSIDAPISSTVIRKAIERGDIGVANELLDRVYSFRGTVIKGDQRGRVLGFPTLNFLFPKDMARPPDGVYVNRVCIGNRWFGGVGNMGDNPTFENQYHRFEVHIFDFNEDVYGQVVEVQFLQFLRSEVRFDNLEALITQMKKDEEQARLYLKRCSIS